MAIVFGKDRATGSHATTTAEVGSEPVMEEENEDILNNQSPDFENFYIPDPPFASSPTSEDFPTTPSDRGSGSSLPSRSRKSQSSSIGEYSEVVREGFQLLTKSIDGIAQWPVRNEDLARPSSSRTRR